MLIKISTHSGNEYETEVVGYDAEVVNEKLNNPEINTIALGGVIISRIDVKIIVPIS